MNKKIEKKIEDIFIKNNGYGTTKELYANGINWYYINRLESEGRITRIKRGLYKLNDKRVEYTDQIVEVFKIVPQGVLCLTSALSYYELTTYNPWQYEIAIERDMKVKIPGYPPIKIVYFSRDLYELGIIKTKIDDHEIKVYDMEKTICDCIRYRNKIGIEMVKESLNEYIKRNDKNISKLVKYAKECRVYKILKEYMEVLI